MIPSDTIAAIATPVGSGGIGVIRISGESAIETASRVFTPAHGDLTNTPSHTARFGRLITSDSKAIIDQGVATVFVSPHSYTGENVVELSCHGGVAVLRAALAAVLTQGARLAEPGEFTKRAFLNGKLDLAQAEAVNDIILAQAEGARKVAERQLEGQLSRRVKSISSAMMDVCSTIEAAIDFPDDVDEPDKDWLLERLSEAVSDIAEMVGSFEKGRILREGLRVVIAGEVNVGKSSLLNALLRHARAIVSPIPGTTRDLIEDSLQIRGIPVVAVDTAGIRHTTDPVERMGVDLALASIEKSDLVLLVIDATAPDTTNSSDFPAKRRVIVINKSDLIDPHDGQAVKSRLETEVGSDTPVILASALTGVGLEEVEDAIAASTGESLQESALVTNARHQQVLMNAGESLKRAIETLQNNEPIDLASVDLSAARRELGLITGETATEDLLDAIFSKFCIGK